VAVVLALVLGIITGNRSMTGPAIVSWASFLGWVNVRDSPLAFLAHPIAPWAFTAAALGELVADKLPGIPSRKSPGPFVGRILFGAMGGGALGISGGMSVGGVAAGIVGAILGTLGGYSARAKLASLFGKDLPAALLEDALTLTGGILSVWLAKGR
jgi:uncharacterized membrane protein